MLEELKERVCKANIQLRDSGLVILTWGNVSAIDREKGLMVIKPSGVSYDELTPDKMVVVNMDGKVVEGDLNPSSDTPTHLVLYQAFDEIGAVVHTHSRYATVWAQAGLDIVAYGTTHADYFYGDIPCTMQMSEDQIVDDYERNTGIAITDTFARRRLGCMEMQACLVASHGPFVWGATPEKAVENSIVLEEIAHMAVFNAQFQFGLTRISEALLNKHYLRKHGENAYYGQTFGKVDIIKPADPKEEENPDIKIEPSKHTVDLKNINQIAEVERPVINKIPKREEDVFKIPENFVGETENMDIVPSEPDGIGEPLIPNDPEISLTMIAPEKSSIPSQNDNDYTGKESAKPYSPPKAEYKPVEGGMELKPIAGKEHEKRNAAYSEPETPTPYSPPKPKFNTEDIGFDLKPVNQKKFDSAEKYVEPETPTPYAPPKPKFDPAAEGFDLKPIKKQVYESQFGFNFNEDGITVPSSTPPAPVVPPPIKSDKPVEVKPEIKTEKSGVKFTPFKSRKERNKEQNSKPTPTLEDTVKNTEPAKAPEPPKPAEAPKPVEPSKPVETPKPVEPSKPVETPKPVEPPKPVETPKPIEPPKNNNDSDGEPLDFTF